MVTSTFQVLQRRKLRHREVTHLAKVTLWLAGLAFNREKEEAS